MENKNTTTKNIKADKIKHCGKILLNIKNRKDYIDLFYKHINKNIDTLEFIDKMNKIINKTNIKDDELNMANNILRDLFLIDKYTLNEVQGLINSVIQNKPIEINNITYDYKLNKCNYQSKKISISNKPYKQQYHKSIYYREILVPIRN